MVSACLTAVAPVLTESALNQSPVDVTLDLAGRVVRIRVVRTGNGDRIVPTRVLVRTGVTAIRYTVPAPVLPATMDSDVRISVLKGTMVLLVNRNVRVRLDSVATT